MNFEFEEYRILEVPDDFQRLFVRLDQPFWIDFLRTYKMPDEGKYSGITLGAYRRGKYMPWFPGGVIEVWVRCARQESATGVPWPHCHFKQIVGRRGYPEDISIYCPSCRADRPWETKRQDQPKSKKPTNQLSLF